MFDVIPLAQAPADAVETLLDAAFGADRRQRTAYRVRHGMDPVAAMSFAAVDRGELVGSIQCWPVALDRDDGARTPLIMVGPVAVSPARQNVGIGRALMGRAIAAADGGPALMLIGDPEYYAQFGFDARATGQWRLPGPFERHRLLARGDAPDLPGMVGPRR